MNSYHFEALSADVDSNVGSVVGRRSIVVILNEITKAERLTGGEGLATARAAAEQLKVYFNEVCAGLGPDARVLAERQEFGNGNLDEAEAELLMKAEKKAIRTTIDKSTAKRLAEAFGARGVDW